MGRKNHEQSQKNTIENQRDTAVTEDIFLKLR